MTENQQLTTNDKGSIGSYVTGYILSILLTLLPLGLLMEHVATHHVWPTHPELRIAFFLSAIAQLIVQLYFFLHVGRDRNNRSQTVALSFAIFVVFVIVGGSLWIMNHLQEQDLSQLFTNGSITPQSEQD